jgi:hypothetical protein
LDGAIRGIAAGKAAPVGQEVPKGDTTASEAADQAAVCWRRNLTEVDGNRGCEATSPPVSQSDSWPTKSVDVRAHNSPNCDACKHAAEQKHTQVD